MISLVSSLPDLSKKNAESIKINCLFQAYKNDDRVLFWVQDENKAVINIKKVINIHLFFTQYPAKYSGVNPFFS